MKRLFLFFPLFIMAIVADAQVRMPAPSPTQKIKQDFALSSIELTYSRPSKKGRKVMGDLVPFGKVWRTGANAATLIRFNEAVTIGGNKVDTGSYSLYTVPNIDSWEIILNKNTGNWGASGYDTKDDVSRFRIVPEKTKTLTETFTIQFENILPESCDLVLYWEKTKVTIPIKANIKDRIRNSIEAAMQTEKKPNWQAAQFYNEYDNNPKKALEYATNAVKDNPKAYWIWLYKAKLEHSLGRKTEALESANKAMELATAEKNADYIKMIGELQSKLK